MFQLSGVHYRFLGLGFVGCSISFGVIGVVERFYSIGKAAKTGKRDNSCMVKALSK